VLAEEKYKLYKGFEEDVHFLMEELPMITSAIDEQLAGKDDLTLHFKVKELHQLAQEMEDCIDCIMYRASKEQQPWYRINHTPGNRIRTRLQLAEEMKRLKRRLQEAHQRKERYPVPCPSHPELPPSSSDRLIAREDLVGIDPSSERAFGALGGGEGSTEPAERDLYRWVLWIGEDCSCPRVV